MRIDAQEKAFALLRQNLLRPSFNLNFNFYEDGLIEMIHQN